MLSLVVALSNMLFALVVYHTLYYQKKLSKEMHTLKMLSLYYIIGMAIAMLISLYLLSISV